jgi:hypothetical protein
MSQMPTASTPSPISSPPTLHEQKSKSDKHSSNKTKSKSIENNGAKISTKNMEKSNKSNQLNLPSQATGSQHLSQQYPPQNQHQLLIQNQISQFQSLLTNNININNSIYQQYPSQLPMPPNFPPQPPAMPPCQSQTLPLLNFQNLQNAKQSLGWQEYMIAATSMANALKSQHQSQQNLFTPNQMLNNNVNMPMNQSIYQSAFTTLLKQISEMSHMKSIKEEVLVDKAASGGHEQDVSSISTSSSTCSSNYDMNNNKQNGDDYEEEVEVEEGEIDPNSENYDDYDIESEKEAKKAMLKTMLRNSNSLCSSQSVVVYSSSSSSSSTPPSSVSSNSSLCNNKIKLETNYDYLMSHESISNRNLTSSAMSPSSIAKRNLKHSIDFILGANASQEAKNARLDSANSHGMKRQRLLNNNTSHFGNGNGIKKAKNIS